MNVFKLFVAVLVCALSAASFAQSADTIFSGGGPAFAGTYTTGTAKYTASGSSYMRLDNVIAASNNNVSEQRGYAVFNLTSIPAGAVITGIRLGVRITALTSATFGTPTIAIYAAPGSFTTVTNAATLHSYCGGGAVGSASITAANIGAIPGEYTYSCTAGATLSTLVENSAGGRISLSFVMSYTGSNLWEYNFGGETYDSSITGLHCPYLIVTYNNPPPCSGTPNPGLVSSSVYSGCSITPITLTSNASGGVTCQWQLSPDSLAWSNISGATNAAYSLSGIAATTYYRMVVTCPSGGLSATSPGVKVPFFMCCTGTPVAGTASASTTFCSACSLTLNLAGYATGTDITYQWQYSWDNVTWTDIAGATAIPHTFTPVGAAYYRCKVKCTTSGLSSFSNVVFVGYQYNIISNSMTNPSAASCAMPRFTVVANGSSSLLYLKTYYGNASTDSLAMNSLGAGATSSRTVTGNYTVPGTYTVKQVLYYNNIPQDSVTFSYTQTACKSFPLRFYADANANCSFDASEYWFNSPLQVQVDSSGVPIDTISVTAGLFYVALGSPGTIYGFKVLPNPMFTSCIPSGYIYDTIIATATSYPTKYYGLNCTSGTFDLAVDILSYQFKTDRITSYVRVRNIGCIPTAPTLVLNYDPLYVTPNGGSWVMPSSSAAGTAAWSLPVLVGPYAGAGIWYQADIITGSPLTMGATVNLSANVTPLAGDANTANNSQLITDTVRASWDPNNIFVLPAGCFDHDTEFRYTINFENLGNDTAHNVYVMDTLDANLDMNTLKMVTASSVMDMIQYKAGGYNIVKFDFPGIDLADATHPETNKGAVVYTIKNRTGIADGTILRSRAGIYFDINPVVLTNTAENVKGCPDPVSIAHIPSQTAQLYPNPATNKLTIKTTQQEYTTYTIANSIGQTLIQQSTTGTQTIADVHMLPAGVYYVTLRGSGAPVTMKFVKM